jgi:hypothetical protein
VGVREHVRSDLLKSTADTSYVLMSSALLVVGLGTGCVMAPVMSAVHAVVLQHNLTESDSGLPAMASAIGDTFRLPLASVAVAILPALFLPRASHHRERSQGK